MMLGEWVSDFPQKWLAAFFSCMCIGGERERVRVSERALSWLGQNSMAKDLLDWRNPYFPLLSVCNDDDDDDDECWGPSLLLLLLHHDSCTIISLYIISIHIRSVSITIVDHYYTPIIPSFRNSDLKCCDMICQLGLISLSLSLSLLITHMAPIYEQGHRNASFLGCTYIRQTPFCGLQ